MSDLQDFNGWCFVLQTAQNIFAAQNMSRPPPSAVVFVNLSQSLTDSGQEGLGKRIVLCIYETN